MYSACGTNNTQVMARVQRVVVLKHVYRFLVCLSLRGRALYSSPLGVAGLSNSFQMNRVRCE